MFVYVGHNIQIFAKFIANILNAMLPQVLDVQKFINMWSMQLCEVYITQVRSDSDMLRPFQVCPIILC